MFFYYSLLSSDPVTITSVAVATAVVSVAPAIGEPDAGVGRPGF